MKRFPNKEKLREAKIFNPWELAHRGTARLYICFNPKQTGRVGCSAHYQVIHLDEDTDPTGPWYNYKRKTFSVFSDTKEEALAKAIAWADEKYGKHEWVRTPWGDYVDVSCLQPAIDAVKALKNKP